jgi:hypothetical protein
MPAALREVGNAGQERAIVLRWESADPGGARINSGGPRGVEGGRVWRVRRRQQAGSRDGFRASGGTSLGVRREVDLGERIS